MVTYKRRALDWCDGYGGYGKSVLVAKLCETVTADFPQQLWISFSNAYPLDVWEHWLLDQVEKTSTKKTRGFISLSLFLLANRKIWRC
ncbi:hypothetical protein [Nostoc sp. C117]|uniref:hypothetical protein n=1 Tax=Nostoc sp. C117 TaxID=3349875 RepID=UPI00370D32BC